MRQTYSPCDDCQYGIDRRDGSGSDRTCKICEFAELIRQTDCARPLTQNEIRQMGGQPVWVQESYQSRIGKYGLVDATGEKIVFSSFSYITFRALGKKLLYARKPVGNDGI